MIDQETEPAPTLAEDSSWLGRLGPALVVTVAGGALGALGGWLWYLWWGPPNNGSIYDTATWGPRWLDLSDKGIAHQFAGPGQYAVIALGFGVLLGILAAVLGRRRALAALAGLVIGSALAAYLAWAVGTALSPPDPQRYATADNVCREEPCEEYPAAIELSGWTPLLVWPIASLGAFCTAIIAMSGAGEVRRQQVGQQEAGAWLQPVRVDRSEP
ncbi:hypothetical protein [Nocardioides pelophilus]|uniref:hypothetical protein n=1 Tax=Nocardioides pelophilus TaxID=2172019 RepID=UPI0016014BA1|nr:hypothetical protein [Nocardioides pelophilus]